VHHPLRSAVQLTALAAALALGWACSPSDLSDKDAGSNDTAESVDPEDPGDSAAPEPPDVAYWGLGGQLSFGDAGLTPLDAALVLAQRGAEPCEVGAAVLSATLDPDRALLTPEVPTWWTLELVAQRDPACLWLGPTTLALGFGAPTVELDPPAARAGLTAASAYGLYVWLDDASTLIGVAGTAEQLSGTAQADPTLSPPPGTYDVHTLHGIPL
jgi:hypothetical protein